MKTSKYHISTYSQITLDRWKRNFNRLRIKHGIRQSLLNEVVTYNGKSYKVIGMMSRYQKYPFIIVDVSTGNVFKVPKNYIPKQYFLGNSNSTVNVSSVIVFDKKELEYQLKRFFNSIWRNKDYFDIVTPDGKVIATYNRYTQLAQLHPQNVQIIKKSR